MRGRGTGLLQLHSLASYLLIQSSSVWPTRPYHARRSKLQQQTPDRASWCLSTLSRSSPRVADVVNSEEEGTEAKTEEEHRRLPIREACAPPP
jgi:hypothetical protein